MLKEHYDYLIVGCGIYGITVARHLADKKYNCLIIDKRGEIGGNCHTTRKDGTNGVSYDIHDYGPHIFHTSDQSVIDFVTTYSNFNRFELNILAEDENGKRYHLPFSMNTFSEIFGVNTVDEVKSIIRKEIGEYNGNDDNLEGKAVSMVGTTIYRKLIKNYTEKQWGKDCTELPSDIIKRLPLRFTFNNDYFNDKFEGIPSDGYTEMLGNIINGTDKDGKHIGAKIDVELGVDFLEDKDKWMGIADKVIYCGSVDELLDYRFGVLPWRSLSFEHKVNEEDSQGCPIINYVSPKEITPYTRSISHIHFADNDVIGSYEGEYVTTYEYPSQWEIGKERYYPIDNDESRELYGRYVEELKTVYPNIHLGGRIGLYKYLDMDDAINEAISYTEQVSKKEVYDYERYNCISDFCKVWVVGTNEGDVKGVNGSLVYNTFVTNNKYKLHNINNLNRMLSEYVAFYYVWKNNIRSDYVGFCHYRRMINVGINNIIDVKRNNCVQYFHYYKKPNTHPTDEWDFIRDKFIKFASPQFMIDDAIEYLKGQKVIPLEKIKDYCCSKEWFIFANREIFFTNWDNFCYMMEFLDGYVEFVKNKYKLVTFDDWKKHMLDKVISHYKERYEKLPHDIFSEYILWQSEKDYLRIYDKDYGFGSHCNCWRAYAYAIEVLVSVAIMTSTNMRV